MLLLPTALAFTLEEVDPLPLPAHTLVRAGPEVAALLDTSVVLTDAAGKQRTIDVVAVALAERDGAIWTCGPAGITREGVPVTAEPCVAIAAVEGGFVATGGSTLERWNDDSHGGLVLAGDAGVSFSGTPVVAGDGARAIAASLGGAEVYVVDAATVRPWDSFGAVSGVAVVGEDLVYTYATGLVIPGDHRYTLAEDAGGVSGGDLDADGEGDAVIAHPATFGVFRLGIETPVEGEGRAVSTAPGTLCDSVWLATGDEVRRFEVVDCGVDADLDGDGYSPERGDCDDANSAINPGAYGECEVLDLDCDGILRVGGVSWPTEVALLEGTSWDGPHVDCFPGATLEIDVIAEDALRCVGMNAHVACFADDDATAVVSARVLDAKGTVFATYETSVTALNRPPTSFWEPAFSGCDDEPEPFGSTAFSVNRQQEVRFDFAAMDVPADVLSYTFRGGPPGLRADEDGLVLWTPRLEDLGVWSTELVIADDDGAEVILPFEITVQGCACPAGSSVFAIVGGALALRRRRRR